MPNQPPIHTELGRRMRALHDAAAELVEHVQDLLAADPPPKRFASPDYRAAIEHLAASPRWRHLAAELAAFQAFMRQIEPRATFPPAVEQHTREGDYDMEGRPYPPPAAPPAGGPR